MLYKSTSLICWNGSLFLFSKCHLEKEPANLLSVLIVCFALISSSETAAKKQISHKQLCTTSALNCSEFKTGTEDSLSHDTTDFSPSIDDSIIWHTLPQASSSSTLILYSSDCIWSGNSNIFPGNNFHNLKDMQQTKTPHFGFDQFSVIIIETLFYCTMNSFDQMRSPLACPKTFNFFNWGLWKGSKSIKMRHKNLSWPNIWSRRT